MTFINLIPPIYATAAQFGASPSAPATQNDAAFAAAIASLPASGGVIAVPAVGKYFISQPIVINNDGVSLVSFGERDGSATIQIDPSADPSYALIVGNTRNADSCLISGITFIGRSTTTSTGKGIHFRSNGGKIQQSKVALFGGNGIEVDSFSGTIYEVFFDDVELVWNGMNTTTPGDNLVINGGASDCEYHRVISQGDAAKSTTNNGITINGAGQQKFVDCHCYFCKSDGFYIISGVGCQILGGEFENNTLNGIETSGINTFIVGASCFGNSNTDIASYAQCNIIGCNCYSVTFENIYVNSANGGIIANNTISGSSTAIAFDTGASGFICHDNVLSATGGQVIATKSTNSEFHDNVCLAGQNIIEQTGAQGNNIHDNTLIGGGTITQIGTNTRIRNNIGFNPRGHSVTQPAVPATTVAATNTTGCDCTVHILGGTLTLVSVGGSSVGITAAAPAGNVHSVRVPVGQTIAITYSVAPTWQ